MSNINFSMLADFPVSNHQKEILNAIKNTNKNLCIEATAGSGKTTTILMGLKLIPRFRRVVFLSFSNTIVKSLRERVPAGVRAATLHSLGNGFIHNYYPQIRVNENKYLQLALDDYNTKNKEVFKKAYKIQEVSKFARMTLTNLELNELSKMCDKYDLDYSDEILEKTIQLIRGDVHPRTIDFADMIFYPAINEDMVQETFHYVFVDEAQDLNNAQIQFIKNITKEPDGRIIAVGDSYQSIYGFSGSDIESFKRLKDMEGSIELPLSISFRCPKAVVEEAQKFCPNIQAAPKAIKGEVRWGDINEIQEGDMVLSRNNAPLVDLYFDLVDAGKKAKIYGKEIEKGITQLAEKCMAPVKDRFMQNLMDTLDELVDKLIKKGVRQPAQHEQYINLSDKIDLLEIICNKVNSTKEIIPTIQNIFVENDTEGVKLMTLHKSKGLENDTVFFMKNYKGKQLIPSQYATQKWQLIQENNLQFVGVTRAMKRLIYFDFKTNE